MAARGEDWAELSTSRTVYLTAGVELRRQRVVAAEIGSLPVRSVPLVLRVGDALLLTAGGVACAGPPAQISCTSAALVDALRPGDPVWFDDGAIGAEVAQTGSGVAELRITFASPRGSKLRAEKGINAPETHIAIEPLTPKDHGDLAAVVGFADVVALSFASSADHVGGLRQQLSGLDAERVGIVLKIETRRGFAALPELLLAALAHERVGVMIARGDLAVECGWTRLAEVQEEILWLCEAAAVPVIWATQVLDTLARTGAPSRAEVTDAAMADRAECVMLNKGPYVEAAISALADILGRMGDHQDKKRSLLRRLTTWRLPEAAPASLRASERAPGLS